jgi:hypothetical protein
MNSTDKFSRNRFYDIHLPRFERKLDEVIQYDAVKQITCVIIPDEMGLNDKDDLIVIIFYDPARLILDKFSGEIDKLTYLIKMTFITFPLYFVSNLRIEFLNYGVED